MDDKLRALIDAPLADPAKRFLPEGRRTVQRGARHHEYDGIDAPRIGRDDLAKLKQKAVSKKLSALYDYYATTDLSFEKIAQHMGIYRNEQTGVDDKGKPVIVRVLDVKAVEAQISWRRKA